MNERLDGIAERFEELNAKGKQGKPKIKLDPVTAPDADPEDLLAGVVPFNITNEQVNNTSSAQYIYSMLDFADRKLIMMLTLPYIRDKLVEAGKLVPAKCHGLIDNTISTGDWTYRIRRLCIIGAIMEKGKEWIAHPNVSQLISQRSN